MPAGGMLVSPLASFPLLPHFLPFICQILILFSVSNTNIRVARGPAKWKDLCDGTLLPRQRQYYRQLHFVSWLDVQNSDKASESEQRQASSPRRSLMTLDEARESRPKHMEEHGMGEKSKWMREYRLTYAFVSTENKVECLLLAISYAVVDKMADGRWECSNSRNFSGALNLGDATQPHPRLPSRVERIKLNNNGV